MTNEWLAQAETRDAAWLEAYASSHGFSVKCKYDHVRSLAEVTAAGDFPAPSEGATAWVVTGDLVVAGNVWVNDTDALFVEGRTTCQAFVTHEGEVHLAGGLSAQSCVVVLQYDAGSQQLGKVEVPVLVLNAADGKPASLDVPKDTAVISALPPSVAVADFVRVLSGRRTDVIAALRSGDNLARFFAPPPSAISPRVKAMLAAIAGGAKYEWTQVNGQAAMRLQRVDGSKQTAVFSKAEEEAMRAGLEPAPPS